MGARMSDAMCAARDLVLTKGVSAYEAAKTTGISPSAISKARWYREHVAANPTASRGATRVSDGAMARARDLVVSQGLSARESARIAGISASSIVRAKWYKDFIASLDGQLKLRG